MTRVDAATRSYGRRLGRHDRFDCTRQDVAAGRDEARRRPTHEHVMTDLPNSAADRADNASTPGGETPAGDPELAALVRRDAPPDDADPSLAALVNPGPARVLGGPRHPGRRCPCAGRADRHRPGGHVADLRERRRCRAGPAPRGRRDRCRALGTASAPTVARPPLRRLVRPGRPARLRHRHRRPVRMGPAVRRPGPARRPRRQHGTRRAHPRAGGGEDRERLWVARHRADHAHRPRRPDDDHQLRRRRPRPRHLGAARRGTRRRPPE